jgi:seryl-tRNA synthetase
MFIYREGIFIKSRTGGETAMSKKIPSKDEALEALDFIVSVLKEHEKDLDRLISELGSVTEKMGDTGELSGKVEKVEERLSTLQGEITNLITYLSAQHEALPVSPQQSVPKGQKDEVVNVKEARGPPVILRCKQWEDFQAMATEAQTASYMYREAEKTFQVDAVKDGQITTYSGELPRYNVVLKAWLAKQLNIPEKKVLEGVLAVG